MKKLILMVFITISVIMGAKGQIYSAQLRFFNGVGNIYYPNGFYQGGIIQGVANGTGVFYFVDGSFIYGNFINGIQNGPGVIVSRYGYISGCWSNGTFVGQCQDVQNPYNNNQKVQQIVTDVQSKKPDDNRYTSVDPDGYRITRIDPDTQLGHSILGNYHN